MTNTWTQERTDLLRTLWMQGLSASQIAARLTKLEPGNRVTRNAVIGKRMRLCLPDRQPHNRNAQSTGLALTERVIKRIRANRQRAIAAKTKPSPQSSDVAPAAPVVPATGPHAVRFIDRLPTQCAMFCMGEEGAYGFVCGAPVQAYAYCANCLRLVYETTANKRVA